MLESLFINFEIIAAFIAALFVYRDKYFSLVALFVVLICFIPDSFLADAYRTINTFTLISLVFIALSFMLFLRKKYLPALAVLLLSIYCAIFATDTWINSNAETWIFINHENIIVGLYFIALLSFSKRVSAVVVACFGNISGVYANIKLNSINNPSYKRREGEAKDR
jgi:hypothetical protein